MAENPMPPVVPQLTLPVPQRKDPTNFRPRADVLMTELPLVVDGINAASIYIQGAKMDVASMEGIRDETYAARDAAEQSQQDAAQSKSEVEGLISGFSGDIGVPDQGGQINSPLLRTSTGVAFNPEPLGAWSFEGVDNTHMLFAAGVAQSYKLNGLDTSGGPFGVLLPASPSQGEWVRFFDVKATWGDENPVIERNGHLIMGIAEDMEVDIMGKNFTLTFVGGDYGWVRT